MFTAFVSWARALVVTIAPEIASASPAVYSATAPMVAPRLTGLVLVSEAGSGLRCKPAAKTAVPELTATTLPRLSGNDLQEARRFDLA